MLLVIVLRSSPGSAQISCHELTNTDPQEKILLDDLLVTPSSESSLLMAKLHSEIRGFASAMESRFPLLRLSALRCPGRMPSEGDFFNSDQIRFLYSRGILLEVWGDFDVANHEGLLRFAVVPLRFRALSANLNEPLGLNDVSVGQRDFRDSLESIGPVFVTLALGMKAFENEEYPRALRHLCTTHIMLQRLRSELSQPRRELLDEYLEKTLRAVAEALAKQPGPLGAAARLLGDDTCGAAS
jgi:hypothetical protein